MRTQIFAFTFRVKVKVDSVVEITGRQAVDHLITIIEKSQPSSRMSIENCTINSLRIFQISQFKDLLEQSESTCYNESDRPFFFTSR